MKTLILTLLAFAIYFLLVNIIPKADSMRKPYAASVISSRVAAVAATAQSAPQRQPVTGLQTNLPMVASAPETMPAAQASSAGNPDTTEVVVTQPASEPVAALPEVVILEPEVVMVEELEASVPVSSAEESLGTSVEEVSLQMVVPSDQVQLDSFTATVMNGQAGQVVGVFVPGSFALPVLQQPSGSPAFVSEQSDVITQFGMPGAYGVVGLLAHNYLSGNLFFHLREDQEIVIVYGDGAREIYRIFDVHNYQALTPNSAHSKFIDLDDPYQQVITAGDLFTRVYTQSGTVVFQTCIDAFGNPSWGRIFLRAERVQ
jgi:hypothetical protein